MPALENAVKRRTHKERAQPTGRRSYGLLEKKKDYVLRARDFHRKEATIKKFQKKAEERNPDEFYFAMEKACTKDGVHIANTLQPNKYSQEELALMKTQDVKYLSLKTRVETEKVRKLRSSLHFIGAAPPPRRHIVFVDCPQEAATFDAATHFDTPAELLGRAFNRPRTEQLTQPQLVTAGAGVATAAELHRATRRADRKKQAAYRELSQRVERLEKVGGLAAKMAYQKEVMKAGGRKRKLRPDERVDGGKASAAVFKWKRERKK